MLHDGRLFDVIPLEGHQRVAEGGLIDIYADLQVVVQVLGAALCKNPDLLNALGLFIVENYGGVGVNYLVIYEADLVTLLVILLLLQLVQGVVIAPGRLLS